ncbi:hypothetical protein [uncultured Nostoc sp.]|uniref:hypothetical protein n=1 Tax=uncultured Nostoc sp. TaxID=340711 RepID=UPI00260DF596|nr:hypothetical protein [uncultured Nostoc sp.]
MLTIIPETEQTIILKKLNGLPPFYLLGDLNLKQIEHWFSVKSICQKIHSVLERFFSGNPPLEELVNEDKELFGRLLDFYVTLYFVIHWGWKDIEAAFAKWHTSYYTDKLPFESPGETLAEILERDAAVMFWQCKQGRFDFRPRKLYQLHLQKKKKAKGKLSDQASLQYEKDAKALARPFESLRELEIFCVEASYLGAQERNDIFLNFKIQELLQKSDRLSDELNRYFRDAKGHAWEDGNKLETIKEGGTYKRGA